MVERDSAHSRPFFVRGFVAESCVSADDTDSHYGGCSDVEGGGINAEGVCSGKCFAEDSNGPDSSVINGGWVTCCALICRKAGILQLRIVELTVAKQLQHTRTENYNCDTRDE